MKFSEKQKREIKDLFNEYFRIRIEFDEIKNFDNIPADIDHSWLLDRLLDGEKPYKWPVPFNGLYDGEKVPLYEASLIENSNLWWIAGSNKWEIVEKINDGEYIVQYKSNPEDKFRISKNNIPIHTLVRSITEEDTMKYAKEIEKEGKFYVWMIQKVEDIK